MELTQLLTVAIEASIVAGEKIMEVYVQDDFGTELKADNSPLTKADLAAHDIIESYLSKTIIPILSEEGKEIPFEIRRHWKRLWIVDPLDGTKEFINRNGEFTVNIALVENNKPTLGVIFAPVLKELYFSTEKHGAFKVENVKGFDSFTTFCSTAQKLPLKRPLTYTVVASRSHLSDETKGFIRELEKKHGEVITISKGSSLKFCMVAEGLAHTYPRFAPTMEWDTAAGQAICEHSGLKVMDWETQVEMIYNREDLLNNWFLVV